MKLLRDDAYLYSLFLQAFGIILNHLKYKVLLHEDFIIKYHISADTALDALIRNSFQITLRSFLELLLLSHID